MGYEELLIIGLNLTFVIGVSMYVLMTVHHSTFLLLVVYHRVQFLGHYYFYYILMIFVMPLYWSSWFLPCDAMHSVAIAGTWCPSVCPSRS